jgi:aryl-alcohol dehydrogenase
MAKALGATHIVDDGAGDVAERIVKITGAGVNFSVDCTGVPKAIATAIACLAPRGVCGLVGASPLGATVPVDLTHMLAGGRVFRGVVEGEATPEVFIPTLIELYLQGRFPFDKLLAFYPFDRINDAIRDSEAGKVIKAVVRMGGKKRAMHGR